MRTLDRKSIEDIRDELQLNMERLEDIRNGLKNKDEVEILTDVVGEIKEAIDHLGEV